MRIAVAGATGNVGARVVAALRGAGHEVVAISRSSGVDLSTGDGLDAALEGVQAVVDAISAPPADRERTVDYLGTATRNLLAAEHRANVSHHVLLSIVGIHGIDGNPHYAGKREQEKQIGAGPVPWTIVPATQFHDFAEMVVGWTEQSGPDGASAEIAPLLVQPIDPDDIAAVLAEVVTGDPRGRYADVAGPQTQDLVDMARRTLAARGREVTLVPTWSSIFGVEMAGNALLPGDDARIAPTTFDQWLSRQR
ncbi:MULTISPECIES: SDR family oxidoreductase [Mycobacterium]|uniref:NmrA family transcriptional regulator n=1 Tax=Mycobacterium syngnathidarum TaxID=1908205 RepID=A0A1S1K3R5_9MYCO|nr:MULTISPECIES: NAD(P)H-binding protein [Mycobacterium]MCG7609433.1 NAD(P)H-binding protein [Mycobacterium sp. CnD-18-1]OHU01653.1 NmrA family transcriptional regulator [Mycobacterium syngnathidarum]